MDQLAITWRITPNSTRLRVLGVHPVDSGIVQIAESIHYPATLTQTGLVLLQVADALDGTLHAAGAVESVLVRLDGLW